MSAQGITDAGAFTANDRRIVEIVEEIARLESGAAKGSQARTSPTESSDSKPAFSESEASSGLYSSAEDGRKLIVRACEEYGVDAYYHVPRTFGQRTVIWIPEKAWEAFSQAEKAAIEEYMRSSYTNWGIGIGRVSGGDVLADRIVVEN